MSKSNNRKARGQGIRPNSRRQALFALIALAAALGGFGVGHLFKGKDMPVMSISIPPASEHDTPEPWYLSQSPPPSMITTPDAHLFPEPVSTTETEESPARAYEEALPQEVYDPAPNTAPSRKKAVDFEPAPPPQTELAVVPAHPPLIEENLPQWRRFAVAATVPYGRPMIAVVIDDMGVDKIRTAMAIGLKGPLTLSFLSYSTNLGQQTAKARDAGHELLLHVSMEPESRNLDPGPNVLLSGLDPQELRRRLRWGLSQFGSYVGINNHMGSKFTTDIDGMTVVMEELRQRGLLFLDSRTSSATVGPELARRFGVPYAERNVFLDNINEVDAVNARLEEVEHMALRKGHAIAIGHPRDATLEALTNWLAHMEERGFVLVPLTTIVNGANAPG